MILLTAVFAGLLAGLARARWQNKNWQPPELHHGWLVLVAFLPQLLAFYLPASREQLSNILVATCLVGSQFGLLVFCLLNMRQVGIVILATGLLLNLTVIIANGGFMPLSTETAARLIPASVLQNIQIGSRLGYASKDVLLSPSQIVLPWLTDRFLPPGWFPYRFAFSLGDVFIGLGAFLLLSLQPGSPKNGQKGYFSHVNEPGD